MRKLTLTILAAAVVLALAGVAAATTVAEGGDAAGNNETAVVHLGAVDTTTAYALGVWSSTEVAAPVVVSYDVVCANPANNASQTIQLVAGRFVADAAFLWVGNRGFGSPWHGWGTCSINVTLSQTASDDHELVAWLVSHD